MKKLVGIFLTLTLASCASYKKTDDPSELQTEYLTGSTLWVQQSAEYRALCEQAYFIAEKRLTEILRSKKKTEKLAVVVDVDETVLDNSPYEAMLVLKKKAYPFMWSEWIDMAKAKPIPGALRFLNYANKHGVRIFYVTNRKAPREFEGTKKNLMKEGFPDVSDETVILRTKESSKESRRKAIEKDYRIALLVGDNLNDFSNFYEKDSLEERKKAVDHTRSYFGLKYIVLPNPMYGEWEGAVYDGDFKKSFYEKYKLRHEKLEAY